MAAPYTSVSISGYDANPPADDGSATAANTVYWATGKTKLSDPLKTAIETMNTNLIAATAKLMGGAGVTSTAVNYTIDTTDQGKLVRASAASITITTPDATAVLSPFVCAVLNNSSGTITLDGNGSQTIDGSASLTIPANGGTVLFTDGTNWFTNGIQGTLVGKQLGYSDIINGTFTESNGSNAVTFSLKTLAGTTPSTSDPVLLCFRDSASSTAGYVYRTVTAALTLTISSGSTLGQSNSVPFKVWLVLFDDAGTIRMGAITTVSGTNVFALGKFPRLSSTAEGGAGAADSAQVFYTGTAVTLKSMLILGYASYESGLATAGSWNVSPTDMQLYGRGVPLPGQAIQTVSSTTTTVASTTSATFVALTSTQSVAITPTSATNLIRAFSQSTISLTNAGTAFVQFARGGSLIGNPTSILLQVGVPALSAPGSLLVIDAPGSTSAQTYTYQGKTSAGTVSYPIANTGAVMELTEIMT